jgi:hypothetical protein
MAVMTGYVGYIDAIGNPNATQARARNQAGAEARPRLMTEAQTNEAVLPKNHCALCRKPVTERVWEGHA